MLTVTAIQKAKPTEKQYRMADERGLVLLVRTNHPQPFRKIVACLDFSETSRAVVQPAVLGSRRAPVSRMKR